MQISHSSLHCFSLKNAKNSQNLLICGAKNVVEHCRKRIKILHGCLFEGRPNRARSSHPFWKKFSDWLNWPCPVRSTLKRTLVQDVNSFSIMFYYIISMYYISKNWRPFLPCSYFWTLFVLP